MTVGELFDGQLRDAAGYVAPRHLIFDFTFIGLPWTAAAFAGAIAARDAAFGPDRWPANVLSNHDQPRHASRYDGPSGDARAKVAASLLATLRGTPFLYYGEELAQRNLSVSKAVAIDPPARHASFLFPWWNRDQARGPIAWQSGPGGGFTTGAPWLPLSPDAGTRNVATESADPASVLSWYRRVFRLRRATPALQVGEQEVVDAGDRDVLAYVRRSGSAAAFVALNFAERPAAIRLPPNPGAGTRWTIGLSTHGRAAGTPSPEALTLEPNEALIAIGS
jgi:alpha-glucosidase